MRLRRVVCAFARCLHASLRCLRLIAALKVAALNLLTTCPQAQTTRKAQTTRHADNALSAYFPICFRIASISSITRFIFFMVRSSGSEAKGEVGAKRVVCV